MPPPDNFIRAYAAQALNAREYFHNFGINDVVVAVGDAGESAPAPDRVADAGLAEEVDHVGVPTLLRLDVRICDDAEFTSVKRAMILFDEFKGGLQHLTKIIFVYPAIHVYWYLSLPECGVILTIKRIFHRCLVCHHVRHPARALMCEHHRQVEMEGVEDMRIVGYHKIF